MATTLQIRRGNTDDNDRFKGASGEITLDTQLWQLRAHDNVTVGGHVIAGGGSTAPVVIPTISLTNTSGLTYTRSVLGNDITFTVGGILSTGYGGTGSASPLMTSTSPLAITGTWPNVNIAISGNVSVDHGGTGLTTTPGQNQVLLGDGSKYNLTTLVPGSGITFDQTQTGVLTIRGGGGSGNSITLADLPPGAIQYFAMQAPPDGWLECNGATLSRTAYNALYQPLWSAIGYQYGGSGDNFNLPDLRGEFIRGWSNGRAGVDVSRAFGTTQTDELKSHAHNFNEFIQNSFDSTGGAGIVGIDSGGGTSAGSRSGGIVATGGTETRPRNIALLPCIKFKPGTAQPLLSSVDVSGGTTGLVFSGGPITTSGTITLASGTLAVANGGTGITVATPAWHYTYGTQGGANTPITITALGQSFLVKFNNQITKQNVNYDQATGRITVTVPGIYHLYAQVQYIYLNTTYHGLSIVKNGATIAEGYNQTTYSGSNATGEVATVYCSITVALATTDYTHVAYNYNASGLDQPPTIVSAIQTSYPNRNYFGGYRVG
jgi:hypothetical protein